MSNFHIWICISVLQIYLTRREPVIRSTFKELNFLIHFFTKCSRSTFEFPSRVNHSRPFLYFTQLLGQDSRCNKVDAVRLYASYRLNLPLLDGQRCVLNPHSVNLSYFKLRLFISVAEFKEFERRFKFKSRFKYDWFHLKLYQMFQDLSRRLI